MGVPKRLTEMQMRFCEILVYNEGRTTGHQACIDAGYSKDNARPMASRLQNPRYFPLVAKYLGELREERLKRFAFKYNNSKINDTSLTIAQIYDTNKKPRYWAGCDVSK